jgi:hypothetical protein
MRYASPESQMALSDESFIEKTKSVLGYCVRRGKPASRFRRVASHLHAGMPRSLLGSSNISVAEANNETPATASPPYKLPVF